MASKKRVYNGKLVYIVHPRRHTLLEDASKELKELLVYMGIISRYRLFPLPEKTLHARKGRLCSFKTAFWIYIQKVTAPMITQMILVR